MAFLGVLTPPWDWAAVIIPAEEAWPDILAGLLSNIILRFPLGSTFMAASGINPYIRKENTHKYQHLHELMEFVMELQSSVNDFNQSLIEFDLILRIGFNFGDVTAGVIGTTKLYYDIWGDAVNIASRSELINKGELESLFFLMTPGVRIGPWVFFA